jgi:PadR family transcriptional regulator PadR
MGTSNDRNRQDVRLSYQGLKVLGAFLEAPTECLYGAKILQMTGVDSGTLYPILIRFEQSGLLESYWEENSPSDLGRPRRRLYRITRRGLQVAQSALSGILSLKPSLGEVF